MSGYQVEVPGKPAVYLLPGDTFSGRRPALDVLGVITRPDGSRGALCRTIAGHLVQVNASATRNLPQREVEAALAAAVRIAS